MLLLIGLCVLFGVLPVEGCSSCQQSLANLVPAEQEEFLPNSSFHLPVNATCQWNITAPVGRVLRITVSAANFKGSCSDEHLTIYDGPNNLNRVIIKYCNGTSTFGTYFFSSGSSLFLEAKTKLFSYVYMRVNYRMLDFEDCSINTTLSAPESPTESNFSSPYYPVGFPMNTTCGWYITAPENHIVKVQVTSKLSRSSSSNDSVGVYDVDGSELSAISVDLDYRTDTGTVYSKFRGVYVLFKSDRKPQESSNERGMFVTYTAIRLASSCSSSNTQNQNKNIILKNSSGTINTPGYPSPYPSDLATQCIWKIIAPKGEVIRLDVLSLRMGNFFCLRIQNDVNMKDPFQMFKCGTWPSFTVYSSGRELGLKVSNSGITPGPGFIANYSFVPAGSSAGTCILENNTTVHISGEGRSFVTPGFPYPRIGACSWNITVPPGKFVKLNFWTFRGFCDKNYAEVFDVTDSQSETLTGKFCDEKVVFSKGNNVYVRYSTKQGVRDGGFFASYEALEAVPAKYACSKKRGYVYKLTGTAGEFASFDYPLTYPNDASCSWDLKVPPTHLVLITFHSFDLQQSQDCKADYVEIKRLKLQGLYYVWQVFRKFCGSSLPASYQSNYSSVHVEFVSDSSGRFPGFHASFSGVPNPAMGPCKLQGVDNVIPLTGTTGHLFSPLYPQTYPPNMTCTWMITVPEGHFVKLKLTSFRLESTCNGAILQIRDGQSESSDLLKSFCRRKFESSVFSSGRHLWVRFQTPDDQFLRGNGFNAFFEAVTQLPAPFSCTDSKRIVKLKSDTGSFASYNYPLSYDKDIECVWVIYVDTDYKIKLSFDFFNLSYSSDCSEDYVEVRDGQFDTSDLLGKFCGSEKPESITSDTWDLRVVFKSSGKKKFPGFTANYETKKSTVAILKIVGIVLGVLSALCTIIAVSCKCCRSHGGEPVVQNNFPAEHAGSENSALKEQTTRM